MMNQVEYGRKRSWIISRYYPDIFLEIMRNAITNLPG
jgi:hypothetical protein